MNYSFLLSFLFATMSQAQPAFLDIFKEKTNYFILQDQLQEQESKALGKPLTKQIVIAYDMVIITLSNKELAYHCELRYWKGKLHAAYCSNDKRLPFIKAFNPQKVDTTGFLQPDYWQDTQVLANLDTAAEIARLGAYCGYDYFSEILISEEAIKISQIDYTDAKSLDPKSYSMWSLVFFIPLKKEAKDDIHGFYDYQMGDITVSFHDMSKPESSCKEKVQAKIEAVAKKRDW